MGIGFGQIAHGRGNFGFAQSRFEPRFELSRPTDGSSGVSVFLDVVSFILYCFSSRLDLDELFLEISEDAGGSYNDAYVNGVFVSPYNGANSRIIQIDGQRAKIYIHKTAQWTDENEIRVQVTGADGFGNQATKETPVKWD